MSIYSLIRLNDRFIKFIQVYNLFELLSLDVDTCALCFLLENN